MAGKKGRQLVMWISGMNIAAEPPHGDKHYLNLIKFIKEKKIIGRFGNERLELDSFTIDHNGIISGTFVRFTYIDPNSPWWNSIEGKAILDKEGQPIPQVKAGIGPNKKDVLFSFNSNLNSHKLLVDLKNISINQFFSAISSILSSSEIVGNFGKINITIIPAQDAIDKVLSIPNLKKIFYKLTIPNPDLLGNKELEKECFRRFENMGAGAVEASYTAQHEQTLDPDETLRAELGIASRNGYVTAAGKNVNGRRDVRSTRSYPKRERTTFSSSISRLNALAEFARRVFGSF